MQPTVCCMIDCVTSSTHLVLFCKVNQQDHNHLLFYIDCLHQSTIWNIYNIIRTQHEISTTLSRKNTYITCKATYDSLTQWFVFLNNILGRLCTTAFLNDDTLERIPGHSAATPSKQGIYTQHQNAHLLRKVNYTKCRSTLLIRIWFLLSAYATPFFSCSMAWNQSSLWHWWLLCAAACPASQDINGQVTA